MIPINRVKLKLENSLLFLLRMCINFSAKTGKFQENSIFFHETHFDKQFRLKFGTVSAKNRVNGQPNITASFDSQTTNTDVVKSTEIEKFRLRRHRVFVFMSRQQFCFYGFIKVSLISIHTFSSRDFINHPSLHAISGNKRNRFMLSKKVVNFISQKINSRLQLRLQLYKNFVSKKFVSKILMIVLWQKGKKRMIENFVSRLEFR